MPLFSIWQSERLNYKLIVTALLSALMLIGSAKAQQLPRATGFAVNIEKTLQKMTELHERFEEGERSNRMKTEIHALEQRMDRELSNPKLLRMDARSAGRIKVTFKNGGQTHGMHISTRRGIVHAYEHFFGRDKVIDFDSKILLYQATTSTFQTDFYGFVSIFYYLLNEKYRNPTNYQKALILSALYNGAGPCGVSSLEAKVIPEVCLAKTAVRGFRENGNDHAALGVCHFDLISY